MDKSSDRPVIYVVDDDASVRRALARLVSSMNLAAETFASAEDFLNARRDRAGCLLIDVRLPGRDGFWLQQQLHAAGNETPVIVLTAHPDNDVRERALAAGAVGFLEKPVDERVLVGMIRAALGR
jgi:FixJ family two-component response regulator